MTKEDVLKRVEHIRKCAGDDEMAHSDEDTLRHEVLQAIAEGADNAKELAEAALQTSGIKFERWCA